MCICVVHMYVYKRVHAQKQLATLAHSLLALIYYKLQSEIHTPHTYTCFTVPCNVIVAVNSCCCCCFQRILYALAN